MNEAFKELLWKFILLFFDDTLIYSNDWDIYMENFRIIFNILKS